MPPRRKSPRNGGTEDATIVASAASSSSTAGDVTNVNSNSSSSSSGSNKSTKTKLKLTIKRWHGVAKWSWGVGDGDATHDITSQQLSEEDDVCIVCQSAFEGVAPGVKYPGDECPVVWGKCGHAFHLQCVSTWLSSQNSTPTCPTCRAEWEYGAVKAVGEEEPQQQHATGVGGVGAGVGVITGGAGGAPLRIHI